MRVRTNQRELCADVAEPTADMRCQPLHRACLTLNEPQPTCSASCKTRPFKVTAHGVNARHQVRRALDQLTGLRDPIDAHHMRHLERDVFAVPSTEPSQSIAPGSTFSMIWPAWEGGFGDLVMWTILPIGVALDEGSLPNGTLGISGALHTRAWHPVLRARRVCTFERDEWYEVPDGANTVRERVNRPLPRCAASACFETLNLCAPRAVAHEESWRGARALDALYNFPLPPLSSASHFSEHGVLKVVLARRSSWHGRSLLNAAELVRVCNSTVLETKATGDRWRLSCQLLSLGSLPIKRAIATLRETDVLVSMHGADVINGMHMLPGRAVVEIVNHNFDRSGDAPPFWFVSCFERHMTPVYAHKRILLAPTLRGEQLPERAWNLNATLPPWLFLRALNSVVRRDRISRFHEQPPKLARAPSQWVRQYLEPQPVESAAVDGYCAFTDSDEGDCDHGTKGSFALGPRLPPTAAWCTAACRSCPQCRFVSMSAENRDCSWFHSCDLSRLETNPASFRTWRVERP